MSMFWWLVLVVAALFVLFFTFGRAPARAGGRGRDEAPKTDAGFMRHGHGDTEFGEEIAPHGERYDAYNPNPGGPAKVAESPELWPDRTGATTAEALGADVPPADQRRDKPARPEGTGAAAGARAERNAYLEQLAEARAGAPEPSISSSPTVDLSSQVFGHLGGSEEAGAAGAPALRREAEQLRSDGEMGAAPPVLRPKD